MGRFLISIPDFHGEIRGKTKKSCFLFRIPFDSPLCFRLLRFLLFPKSVPNLHALHGLSESLHIFDTRLLRPVVAIANGFVSVSDLEYICTRGIPYFIWSIRV